SRARFRLESRSAGRLFRRDLSLSQWQRGAELLSAGRSGAPPRVAVELLAALRLQRLHAALSGCARRLTGPQRRGRMDRRAVYPGDDGRQYRRSVPELDERSLYLDLASRVEPGHGGAYLYATFRLAQWRDGHPMPAELYRPRQPAALRADPRGRFRQGTT